MNIQKVLHFFKQKRFRLFLASLIVSFLMWFITNLSKQYTKQVPVKINFTKVPQGNLVECKDTILWVKIKGSGFSLWSNQLHQLQYNIKVDENKERWNWQNNQYSFSQIVPKNIEVVNVNPVSIKFTQFKLVHKKVAVQYDINVTPKLGYGVTKYTVKPDSVVIYGHQKEIKEIKVVKTEKLHFDNVTESISGKASLLLPAKVIQVSEKTISYKYDVERYTQGDFLVPIQLINVPEGVEVSIFPKQIHVQFQSPLSLFETYKPHHFLLTVDCSALENKTALPIVLKDIPKGMKNVRLLKKSVTFLVLNK